MVSGKCLVTRGRAGICVHMFAHVQHVLSCDWLLGWEQQFHQHVETVVILPKNSFALCATLMLFGSVE